MTRIQSGGFYRLSFEEPEKPKMWWKSHPHWLRKNLRGLTELCFGEWFIVIVFPFFLSLGMFAAAMGAGSSFFFFMAALGCFLLPLTQGVPITVRGLAYYLPPKVQGFLIKKTLEKTHVISELTQTWTIGERDAQTRPVYLWDGMEIRICFLY